MEGVIFSHFVADPLVVDSKCWGDWLRRKNRNFWLFSLFGKTALRHKLPFLKVENDIEDGFDVKFDAESNGDAAEIPKPCSDPLKLTYSGF